MAPRTKEQQIEYNRKRREENARRKAEADAQVKAIKAERKADKAKEKAKGAKPRKASGPAERSAGSRAKKVRQRFAAKTETAPPIKGVDDLPDGQANGGLSATASTEAVVRPSERPAGARAKKASTTIPTQPAPALDTSMLTNPRSRVHKFRTGVGATQRRNMMQVTVTFNKDQFGTLRSMAEFRRCSIAEAIRQCVLSDQGSALEGQKP